MTKKTIFRKREFEMKIAVIASLVLSILATILFFGQKLGISVFLFVMAIIIVTITFLEKHRKVKNRKGYWLTIPIILLSVTYAIYQNIFFQVTNILVMLILYNIMIIWVRLENYQLEFVIRRIFNITIKPFQYINTACKGIGKVFKTSSIQTETANTTSVKLIKQIGIGITVSLPILIIIVALLSSADNTFAEGTKNVFMTIFKNGRYIFNLEFWFTLVAKLLTICGLTLYFISFMVNIVNRKPWKQKEEKAIEIQIETTILNTVVTILNIVYFIFCKIQITNLFDKTAMGTINYANYAREGFFQLMIVSIINFVIIISTTKNKKQSSKIQIYYRKIMNFILLVATAIILGSAFIRMNLYGAEFGYTFLRILVYFALITESILLLPTIMYIFSNNFRPWKCYFIIVTVMYVIMNFSNINQMIARKNINKYLNDRKEIDIYYLTKTKTDGLEEILKLYEKVEEPYLKQQIEKYLNILKKQLEKPENMIEWNYSKWNARKLLNDYENGI